VIAIAGNLTAIRGIGKVISKRLATVGIHSISDFQQATTTVKSRAELSKKIKISEKFIYLWAKQADLMRIKGMRTRVAEIMVKFGIRNVGDLAAANVDKLKKCIDVYKKNHNIELKITINELESWKKYAYSLTSEIVTEKDDRPLEIILEGNTVPGGGYGSMPVNFSELDIPKTRESSFFCDLTEMIVEVGRGIALAQYHLDLSSIEIQKSLDADPNLKGYGLMATWYAMPETTLQVKVNFAMVREEKKEGAQKGRKHLFVSPINAKYQNYFQMSSSMESELKLKIVPIPPPVKESAEGSGSAE